MNRPSLQLISTSSAVQVPPVQDQTCEAVDLFCRNQRSSGTANVYRSEVNLFLRSTGKSLNHVTSADILDYKTSIEGLKASTISRKLTTIRAFFRFCCAEGVIDRDPTVNVKLPKVPDPRPKSLSLPELRKLFACMDRTTPRGLRDYAMFSLMLRGGLRRAEVRGLDHSDLEPKGDFLRVHVRCGKGSKSRHVDVDLSCYDAVMDYTRSLDIEPEGPVFLSEARGFCKVPGRISLSSINARLRIYSRLSNIKCTVHSLRHSYATLCEQGGCHLEDLRESLGHSSLAVTQRYIKRLTDKRNVCMDFLPAL